MTHYISLDPEIQMGGHGHPLLPLTPYEAEGMNKSHGLTFNPF